jgi:hypothetical protein
VTTYRTGALLTAAAMLMAGCAPHYSMVPAGLVSVTRGAMKVEPAVAWNRAPKARTDIAYEESWTGDGPLLDSLDFIGGLTDGRAIARQHKKEDRKIPLFRANMSAPDLVSMIESYYRIRGSAMVFEVASVTPHRFLGHDGILFDYDWVGADAMKRHGRVIAAIVNRKFYMIALNGASMHYFQAALPQFEALTASARL